MKHNPQNLRPDLLRVEWRRSAPLTCDRAEEMKADERCSPAGVLATVDPADEASEGTGLPGGISCNWLLPLEDSSPSGSCCSSADAGRMLTRDLWDDDEVRCWPPGTRRYCCCPSPIICLRRGNHLES